MAPRAAVDVSGRALLAGRVEPIEFELIGAQIVVRRQRDGSFQLGFGAEAAGDPSPAPVMREGLVQVETGVSSDGKQDRADTTPPADDAPAYQTAEVLQFLDQELLSERQGASAGASVFTKRPTLTLPRLHTS